MNKRRYKDHLYSMRQISDLRDLVKSSAAMFPDKTAFYVKDVLGGEYRPVTFAKFDEDVDALGTVFCEMGLKGKKIALIGENSYEWVVTYCAAVNGTGVIVPLDKELQPGEIGNLLIRSGAGIVVCSQKMEETVKEAIESIDVSPEVIVMTEFPGLYEKGRALIGIGDVRFTSAKINAGAVCSILFTSGTTGYAKGVMLSHKNIASNIYNVSKFVKINEDGIGLSVLPMHHTYELTCHIFAGLYQGIAIAICEGLKYIAKNMAEIKVTAMLGVPLVFESMHKKIWKQAEASGKAEKMRKAIALSKKLKLYNHPFIVKKMFKEIHAVTGGRIELFVAGGAPIDPGVIEDFEAMGFPMIQGYGLTECSPLISVNRDRYSKAASAGFPLCGTEIKIADPDEAGMGEILCKSDSVMSGYYGDPEETEKVLKDGWLYTGDYGYLDKDGMLYISGRKKNVIVTKNGKNIFPEEVEFYLTQSPYILEALVHGIEDENSGDTVVKAELFPDYELILEERGEIEEQEIYKLLKTEIENANEFMPLFKRVRRFDVRKTEFSKTTTRKIKRYTAENYCEPDIEEEERC